MKKFMAIAIAVLMMVTLAVPTFAANETTGSTTVNYTVGESYTVSIPATLNANGTAGEIGLSACDLLSGSKVVITADSTNDFKFDDTEYTYSVYIGNSDTALTAGGTVGEFTNTTKVAIKAQAQDNIPAGTYSDTIAFTVVLSSSNS